MSALPPPSPGWALPQPRSVPTAVVFLVRGRDHDHEASCRRFIASCLRHPPGIPHEFVLLSKGFDEPAAQERAEALFAGLATRLLRVEDGSFDLGAYRDAAQGLDHERVSFLNGHSEILSDGWLQKLALNLDRPGIGLVGATGSFEQLTLDPRFPPFPNTHLRSNAFLIDRRLFLDGIGSRPIREKLDAFLLESGPESLTRQVLARGLGVRIVGADGRGYPPRLWPRSRTFRLGPQDNLLVGDNQTRAVAAYSPRVRAYASQHTWRQYLTDLPPPGLGQPATAPR